MKSRFTGIKPNFSGFVRFNKAKPLLRNEIRLYHIHWCAHRSVGAYVDDLLRVTVHREGAGEVKDELGLRGVVNHHRAEHLALLHGGKTGGDANPNGSLNDIAGIYSDKLNVLGMMPHPENLIENLVGGIDGRGLFDSLAKARAA